MLSGVVKKRERSTTTIRTKRKVRGTRAKSSALRLHFLRAAKMYLILAGLALLAGMLTTQFFQGQIEKAEESIGHMQALNQEIYNKNIELRAARAQLYSKDHVVSLAQNRFDLFEPEKRQVHLIHM